MNTPTPINKNGIDHYPFTYEDLDPDSPNKNQANHVARTGNIITWSNSNREHYHTQTIDQARQLHAILGRLLDNTTEFRRSVTACTRSA